MQGVQSAQDISDQVVECKFLHAASKAPTITGTAIAASFLPWLRPPPWLGVVLGVPTAAVDALTFAFLPNGPPTTSRAAATSVTFDG